MIIKSVLIPLCWIIYVSRCHNEDEINVNDILRTDLMPTFFMVEKNNNIDDLPFNNTVVKIGNGSIDAALSTMTFHRLVL